MLTYASHLPHSPVLLPQISKGKIALFKKTRRAVAEVAADLYHRRIQTVVLISPYESPVAGNFAINLIPQYRPDLGPLGDFSPQAFFPPDSALAYRLREKLLERYPIKTIAQNLDVPTSTAVLQLSKTKANFAVLPLSCPSFQKSPPLRGGDIGGVSGLTELYRFGQSLRDILEAENKRIALISLGDLARANEDWDKALIANLHDKNTAAVLDSDFNQSSAPSVAGARPLAVVLGALAEINYAAEVLSYQQRFGVGMGVMRFVF